MMAATARLGAGCRAYHPVIPTDAACGWRTSVTVPYYDNLETTPIDGLTCLVEVERIYCLDWDHFGEDDWRELSRIYEALPGALRFRDGPMWFGDDEDLLPYLRASLEPAGLRVHGVLPEADWWAWDERFRKEAAELPHRVRQ